ncbi:UNVERIFIED_CONTAM: hypothetical protein Sradi_2384700 [Sesamum radiatum]|uniref:Uncharacterized protein n=1 Tax=Sesamum radiatum TaxID=300843 RepID=A0AAW2T7K0_SESRA
MPDNWLNHCCAAQANVVTKTRHLMLSVYRCSRAAFSNRDRCSCGYVVPSYSAIAGVQQFTGNSSATTSSAPQTSTPPVSQQHVFDTLMATQPKPETYPEAPEPFVTPSTESYEIPSEPEPPKITEPIHLYGKDDEDTNSISSEDFDTISKGSKDSDANLADITSILMVDAESSRRPQEQGDENVEDSDSDPETTEPTATQPDISNIKPASGPWFTFDDVPVSKRRERLHTFSA